MAVLGFNCNMWDLVPWPGIKPRPPALEARSLSHWATREVPILNYFLISRLKERYTLPLLHSSLLSVALLQQSCSDVTATSETWLSEKLPKLQRVRYDWVTELNVFENSVEDAMRWQNQIYSLDKYNLRVCAVPELCQGPRRYWNE